MANTVYHFVPTTIVNGVTPMNATLGNAMQTQALDALSGLNPDLFTAFVLSGITCTKDGTIANQLDIAAGRAYVTQTDGTLALIVVAADNTHTTSALSSTYHLYLQPDGTWYWNTANSPATNSLHICDVTTDGSGNINVVTDQRPLTTSLLSGAASGVTLAKVGGQATAGVFGVPVIVASVLRQHVTTTPGGTVILNFTPAAPGFYRLSVSATLVSGTGTPDVIFSVNWTDPDSGVTTQEDMLGEWNHNLGAGASGLVGGVNPGGLPAYVTAVSQPFVAGTGGAIILTYYDPATTINDFVSAIIERLA